MIIETLEYLGAGLFMLICIFYVWLMLWIVVCWWCGLSKPLENLSKNLEKLRNDMEGSDDR